MNSFKELAILALALLDGAGSRELTLAGTEFALTYCGPTPVPELSDEICPPEVVRESPEWVGAATLKVMAPLNVLEISWNGGEAVRIMAFSRGTWEEVLKSV